MGVFANKSEFKEFFLENYTPLTRYLNLFLRRPERSKELAQDVFLNLWKKREVIGSDIELKSYLFKMGKNRALDAIRKDTRERTMKNNYVVEEETYQPTDEVQSNEEVKEAIVAAIDILKPKTREIFWLHKFEGLTQQEIADHLDISKRTVEYNVGRALMALKDELIKDSRIRAYL